MKDTTHSTPTKVPALLGALAAAACGGTTEPEPSDLPDLGVPEFAVVNDLELRARLEVTEANPSTRVRVSVSTTNRTDQPIGFSVGGCPPVLPVVYARGVDEWIPYRYPRPFVCPTIVSFVTVDPGATETLPATYVTVADLVGTEFQPGTYVVTARVWGVELLAGQVDAK